jgi:hypothetical protein
MSVETLRSAIASRAAELLPVALERAGVQAHKRGWRKCPCSWCATKREATVVIGSPTPRYQNGVYVSSQALRDIWREDKRREYRTKLQMKEKEI